MNQIIPIKEHNGNQAVSARDLHEFLGASERFNNWFDRQLQYGFTEGVDFVGCKVFNTLARQELNDYALTIGCAKEISMIQRSEKGQIARRYFIACEEKLKKATSQLIDFSNPNVVLQLAQNWKEEQDKRIAAEKRIEIMQPKADFVDRAVDTGHLVDIGQAAKILKLPFGRNTFFKKLKEEGIFFKNRNEPKQEYVERKYFDVRVNEVKRNNHPSIMTTKVLVTQKGLFWLSKIFEVNTDTKIPTLKVE